MSGSSVVLALGVLVGTAIAVVSCGEEKSSTGDAPGGGVATTAVGSGGGEGGGGGGGGGLPTCEECWNQECGPQVDRCLEDEACNCRVGCGEDLACVDACTASTFFDDLLLCIAQASFDPCTASCDAECITCAVDACPDEKDACLADAACVCELWCDDDPACAATCGESDAKQPLDDCVAATGTTCDDACGP